MKNSTFTFDGQDGKKIFTYKWESDDKPRACLLIAHGTAEHAARYENLAAHFATSGFTSYACDLRGHGKTADGKLGVVGPDGWGSVIGDLGMLADIAHKEHPGLPLFLVGHSMGSLYAQDLIQRRPESFAGAVLSGSSGHQPFLVQGMGALLSRLMIAMKGPDCPSGLAYAMTFKAYNKRFLPSPTHSDFDWLSRDPAVVREYVEDPLCGFSISNRLALEYVLGMRRIWKEENEARIPRKFPVLVVAGTEDAFSSSTKELRPLVERYRRHGMGDVTAKYYDGARHEVFNEINRKEVLHDVLAWIEPRLG